MTAILRRHGPWLLAGAAILLLTGLVGWPTLCWMEERFTAPDSFYSHGWLVPLASVWLAWQRRDALSRTALTPSWRGLFLLVPSLLLHAAAVRWHIGFVAGFALIAAVWGLVWTWWGGDALRRLRFPLLFLLFMVPLPGVLLLATSFQMKLMAARMASALLTVMGIPAHQAGSTIQLPGLNVVVDDTCSGLRSLISLIALATLWVEFLPAETRRWQRAAVLASSFPIALTANMVRIVLLSLIALIYGPQAAEGFIHFGSGLVVFGVALLALTWVSRSIQQWPTSSTTPV